MATGPYTAKQSIRAVLAFLARRGIFIHPRLVRTIVNFVWDQLVIHPPAEVQRGLEKHRRVVAQMRPRREVDLTRLCDIYPEELLRRQNREIDFLPPKAKELRRFTSLNEEQLDLAYAMERRARNAGRLDEAALLTKVIEDLR